jgi:aminoglycoside phosphotransferase (APT) family kinase protein
VEPVVVGREEVGGASTFAHRLNVALRAMLRRVDLDAGLVQWIEAQTGATVRDARRTFGGGSRVTWFVDVERAGVRAELVLREESGVGAFAGSVLSLAREGAVYRALRDTAVRVPRLRAASDDGQALLIERAPGTADLWRLSDDERASALFDFVDALAELHGVDVDRLPLDGFARPADAADHALADLALWTALLDEVDAPPDPEIVYALAWLRRHPPAAVARTVLVQGDTGPGNFVADGGRVTGLVDWEFAHLGDPMDDLAWVEYRVGRTPGVPAFDALVERYESRTGVVVDRTAVAYYAVLVQVRCAITTARTIARGGGAVGLAGYLVAHRRFLQGIAVALVRTAGVALPPEPRFDATPSPERRLYDRALEDLETAVVPALGDPAVKLRARSAATLLRHFRAVDGIGRAVADAERDDLEGVLGPGDHDPDGEPLRRLADAAGARGDHDVLAYLARRAARSVALWPDR